MIWLLILALLLTGILVARVIDRWRRQDDTPLAELKRASFLADPVPAYRYTQAGTGRKQHRDVLRYRRKAS